MSDACEMPRGITTPSEIRQILDQCRTIAVVGLSDKPDRDSFRVASYLQRAGYRVIPVNPALAEVLGEKAYPDLRQIPDKIDLVNVFRRSDAVPTIVEEAIAVGARVVWLQEGIVHNEAADRGRAAGLQVVQSRCIMKDHLARR
ncbi:MAG: CoA-binding protein [Gemmataceae bacterium]